MDLAVMEASLYATDLHSMKEFYETILGLEAVEFDPNRHAFFPCGSVMITIFNPTQTIVPDAGVPTHGARGPGHLAFRVNKYELSDWRAKLVRSDVHIEAEVDWDNGARSIYFRDPGGNSIEFVTPDLWSLP